jgi:pyruvate,orthophosphate dikinase
MTADDWKKIIVLYKEAVEKELGKPFPEDPKEQLWGAISAVFGSWMNDRAITYRKLNDIPAWGTAVNVQAMVFGNLGETSATGVAFTRDPSTWRSDLLWRIPDQRAGRGRGGGYPHPAPISAKRADTMGSEDARWKKPCRKFTPSSRCREHAGKVITSDMQDLEFTVEDGHLCTCCKPGAASAPPRLPSRSRWTWPVKA